MKVHLTELETASLPAREKREAEIRLLKKQGVRIDDEKLELHTEERHPELLKHKGDGFFKQGNFRLEECGDLHETSFTAGVPSMHTQLHLRLMKRCTQLLQIVHLVIWLWRSGHVASMIAIVLWLV